MKNVRKMDGRVESFNRAKIEQSVLRAGGEKNLAVKVAKAIPEEVALTTANIRQRVTNELSKKDAETAKRYWETRRLIARESTDATQGTARITEQVMNRLNVKPGEPVMICLAENRHNVKAKRDAVNPRNIQLHEEDMRKIGATEGNRIAVRRQS